AEQDCEAGSGCELDLQSELAISCPEYLAESGLKEEPGSLVIVNKRRRCRRGRCRFDFASVAFRHCLVGHYSTGPIIHAFRLMPYTTASTVNENASSNSAVSLAAA